MAYVPEVDVTQYEDQLQAKVQKVRQLFADHESLPDFEVCLTPSEEQQMASVVVAGYVDGYHMLTSVPLKPSS